MTPIEKRQLRRMIRILRAAELIFFRFIEELQDAYHRESPECDWEWYQDVADAISGNVHQVRDLVKNTRRENGENGSKSIESGG